jgi:hypothetical protein
MRISRKIFIAGAINTAFITAELYAVAALKDNNVGDATQLPLCNMCDKLQVIK